MGLSTRFCYSQYANFSGGDPIFGQNAIGGAITMEMKNGLTSKELIQRYLVGYTEERMRFRVWPKFRRLCNLCWS